jgi:hypothetical protein
MDSPLELEEVNKRLEKMLEEIDPLPEVGLTEQHSNDETLSEVEPLNHDPLHDNPHPTLDSNQQPPNPTSSPSPSFPETPEYIAEQMTNEQIITQYSFQSDIILDQEAVYPLEPNNSNHLENQSLAPLDHTFDAFFQHLTPQHPQNTYDLYKDTNTLNGMDYTPTTGAENYTLAPIPTIDQVPQVYEIKQIPVLVPVTNQIIDHTSYRPYIISTTLSRVTTHHISTMIPTPAPFTVLEESTNFAPAGQHYTTLSNPQTNIYYGIPTTDIFPNLLTDAYPPQELEELAPPSYYHYSTLSTALLYPNPANEYEQQVWSQ